MFDYEVVVCTYNGERYVLEQLASIVRQPIPLKRIIISDDDSTDNTLAIITRFSATTSVPIDVRQRVAGSKGSAHSFFYALSLTIAPYVFLSD